MSKRKTVEEDLEKLTNKIRKLERKIRKQNENVPQDQPSTSQEAVSPVVVHEPVPFALEPEDWLSEAGQDFGLTQEAGQDLGIMHNSETSYQNDLQEVLNSLEQPSIMAPTAPEAPGTSASAAELQPENSSPVELDTDILTILGDDPSNKVKYGAELRKELACRLQHIATEGLSKDNRKDLLAKYLTPANCLLINAPKINLEIKAAIPETLAKRDKGIETKQGQMASAISCLAEVISMQINAKDKNNEMLQKLMDAARLMCDLQHNDSVTRRNFILFTLKKEMKEHITNTKIDSFLFSEGLAETLKSAKAVTKSGVELKADSGNRNAPKKKATNMQPLNRKAPARRPPGPPPPRTRQPATTTRAVPPPPPPPPASSSTRSSRPQQPYPRRHY